MRRSLKKMPTSTRKVPVMSKRTSPAGRAHCGLEKDSGATARVFWSELGESLAQRLAARLGMRN